MFDIDLSTIHMIWKEYQISGKIAKAPKDKIYSRTTKHSSTIQERHDYVIKYLDYSASNIFILFIDETGFDVSIRGNYGRATGGDKTEKIKKIKFKNITGCSAISRTSIMFYKVSERAFNNGRYMDFLSNLMNIGNEQQLKTVVFVMVNFSFHKGA
ncbi:hypothetical protein RF11_13866 [Thelohanellus kitauei]|uniref:Tc1-like transposase DDE domain-containing protein n=1 Tax=Thelohanellus kitauei TaxID=669202 RepID=A0A0C2MSN3_THEKT|nr:hypothetical protein RF11_13866 [Thelohanellus kitauei]